MKILKTIFTFRFFSSLVSFRSLFLLLAAIGGATLTRRSNRDFDSRRVFMEKLLSDIEADIILVQPHTHGINIFNSNVCKQIVNTK